MKLNLILICLMVIVCFAFGGYAQSAKVEIDEFSVDGRVIECNYNLTISVNGKSFRPRFVGNTFVVPQQVRKGKNIVARLQCGAYTISINSLRPKHFLAPNMGRYIWKAGIDSYPFDDADVSLEIEDKVAEVHFITFFPYDYVGTQMQLFIPKKGGGK